MAIETECSQSHEDYEINLSDRNSLFLVVLILSPLNSVSMLPSMRKIYPRTMMDVKERKKGRTIKTLPRKCRKIKLQGGKWRKVCPFEIDIVFLLEYSL
jgi:hypothetical protein